MTKVQVLNIIDELIGMGVRRMQFTGGEPLLRTDLGEILAYCQRKGISTNLNSNGTFVSKRIKELESLDTLTLSLDGPKDVHDFIRGEGSYDEVMEAFSSARKNKIKVRFLTVLSNANLSSIDFMLSKAKELRSVVLFQPATARIFYGDARNPIAAPEQEYKHTIDRIISEKRNNEYIGNSIPGLQHLRHWPHPEGIRCLARYIFCRIESNGDISICPRFKSRNERYNCIKLGFREAFHRTAPEGCLHCWCASVVELGLLISFNLRSLLNLIKIT